MDRREFLKSVLAGGALIASSRLPSLGVEPTADAASVLFAGRGRHERLALTYITLELGATRPFSLLHISDTHLTAADPDEGALQQKLKEERTRLFGGRQEEALRDSLDWAKTNVDYVLHTGDLIDWQSEANFRLVKKYFGTEMFGALGNHEYSLGLWIDGGHEGHDEAWKDRTRAALRQVFPFDLEVHSQIVNGINFVTMDDVFGSVTELQVRRFKAEAQKGLPIVLCLHVPFFTPSMWRATGKFWKDVDRRFTSAEVPAAVNVYRVQQEDAVTRDFIAYLKSEPCLKAILAGHEHVTVQDRFSPTATEYVVGANFAFVGQEILVI